MCQTTVSAAIVALKDGYEPAAAIAIAGINSVKDYQQFHYCWH